MKPIIKIVITLSLFLSGLAVVPFADAKNETFSWQRFADGYECVEDCLIVSAIDLQADPIDEDRFLVYGTITVVDEDGNLVTDAIVSAQWTKLSFISYGTRENTGEDGIASFETGTREGLITLTINNVVKEGMEFDPDSSVLTGFLVVESSGDESGE